MPRILILTSSIDGQTDKIADRIAAALDGDHEVTVASFVDQPVIAGYDAVVVGASVHIGHYPVPLERFLEANLDILRDATSAFFSVSLGAAHDDAEHHREVAETVGTFLDELGWTPDAVTAFGGALRRAACRPTPRATGSSPTGTR